MCAGHEVCAEQWEADGVSALGGKLQALLEHLLKGPAVETTHPHTPTHTHIKKTARGRESDKIGTMVKKITTIDQM